MAFGYIKKAQLEDEFKRCERKGYDIATDLWKRKTEDALRQQAGVYELKIQTLRSDIEIYEDIIREKDKLYLEACEKEQAAKKIFLKVQEFANRINYEHETQLMQTGKFFKRIGKIKDDILDFAKEIKLIPNGNGG